MGVLSLIADDGTILQLDAVTSFVKSRDIAVTESSVMSGAQIGDGVRIGNYRASFSGVCTTAKRPTRAPVDAIPPTPMELDKLLEKMVLSQKRFTLYGNDLIDTIRDVIITNHSVTQDIYLDSVTVAISVKQVFVSDEARQASFVLPSKAAAPQIPKKEEGGTGSKTQVRPPDLTRDEINQLRAITGPKF